VRHGRRLEYFTITWNALEGLVAVVAGAIAGSILLLGFGVDSFIEVTSGSVLLWRMSVDGEVHRRELNERRALKILGVCFLLLAAYIVCESALDLWSRGAPEHSIPGIVLACVSTLVPYIHHSETSLGWYVPDKPLKAVEGCEFIHYLADENQWTDWGRELGILSRHKCLGITYLLRRRVGRIPSVRRG
jgi:hypothetical protein